MSQTMDPLSSISPTRLRRAASSTSVDYKPVTSIFNEGPWADCESPKYFTSTPASNEFQRTAGTGVSFNSKYGGGNNRLLVDPFHDEPETPLRKVRGQSVSGYPQSGLVTPQSASRSYSAASLSIQCTPGQSLPSPLDTPLTTPMSGPLDNTLDYFYDSKQAQDWQNTFDLPIIPPSQPLPSLSSLTSMTRSPSFTKFGNRGEEDYRAPSLSTLSEKPSSTTKTTNSGVNPFYCPPPCLRTRSVSDMPRTKPVSKLDCFPELDASLEENGAGASLKGFGDNVDFSSGFEESASNGFAANDHNRHFFGKPLESSEVPELDAFSASMGFNAPAHLQLPADLSGSSREQSVPDLSRSRSSSMTSCNSVDSEKPFLCTVCIKRFRRMEHLRRHQKTHTLERPFKCTVVNCGRQFSRTDNLKAHILTHTKKSGRNEYIEGLAEMQDIKPIKRRRQRKDNAQFKA